MSTAALGRDGMAKGDVLHSRAGAVYGQDESWGAAPDN